MGEEYSSRYKGEENKGVTKNVIVIKAVWQFWTTTDMSAWLVCLRAQAETSLISKLLAHLYPRILLDHVDGPLALFLLMRQEMFYNQLVQEHRFAGLSVH